MATFLRFSPLRALALLAAAGTVLTGCTTLQTTASAPAAMPPATVSVVPGLRAAAPPVVGSGSEQQPRPAEQGPKLPPLTAPASSDR